MRRTAGVCMLCAAIAVLVLLGCQAQPPQAPPVPTPSSAIARPDYWPTSGWKATTPEQQGMDSAKLAAMFDAIDQQQLNLHSVLVARNGYIVVEAYFDPYGPEVKHQLASVTKSVSGMLTGIAIDRGAIKSKAQPVLGFFPGRTVANLDEEKRAMTLEHLLTLTSGFDCSDSTGQLDGMFRSPDWVQFALDLPMADAPGQQFRYCTPAAHLVSAIVQAATGKSERELANEALFAPMGIPRVDSTDWPNDPQGVSLGGNGLALTPRDMAELGLLYLQEGFWNGQQLVPAEWVRASLTPHTTEEASGRGYGYLTWLYGPQGYSSMMGLGGQDIHIIPAKNLVVVFTGSMDIPTHDREVIKLLDHYIIPAAASREPLPSNQAALAELQQRITRVASPKIAPPEPPASTQDISGKVYRMESNSNGWATLSLTVAEGSDEIVATVNGAEIPIGLDNVYRIKGSGTNAQAFRGHWENANTLVVDSHRFGDVFQWQHRLSFAGDEIVIEERELVMGSENTLRGRVTP